MTHRRRWWDLATDEGRRAAGFALGGAAFVYWVVRGIRPNEILAGFAASLLFAQAFVRRGGERNDTPGKNEPTGDDPSVAGHRDNGRAQRDVGDRDLRVVALLRGSRPRRLHGTQ